MNKGCYVFWKRLFAFWIDSIILAILSFPILILLHKPLTKIGNWGVLIGFVIFILYYGLQNSVLCSGQTPGKKILKIKVLGDDANYLSVQKSLIRALILTPVFILHSVTLGIGMPMTIYSFVTSFISLIVITLFLFNLPQRKSLHDLIVKSCVVNKDCDQIEQVSTHTPKIIISICSVLMGAAIVAIMYLAPKAGLNFNEIAPVASLFKDNNAKLVGYTINHHYNTENIHSTGLSLTVIDNRIKNGNQELAFARIKDLAKVFLNSEFVPKDIDYLSIILLQRATIGTNSINEIFGNGGTIQEWERSENSSWWHKIEFK